MLRPREHGTAQKPFTTSRFPFRSPLERTVTPLRSSFVISLSALAGGIAGLILGYLIYNLCPNYVEVALRRPEVAWTPWEAAGGYGAMYGIIFGTLSGWVIVVADALRNGPADPVVGTTTP